MEHDRPLNPNQNQLRRRIGRTLLRLTDIEPLTVAVGASAAIVGSIVLPAVLSGGKSIPPETPTDASPIQIIEHSFNLSSPLPFAPASTESRTSSTTGDSYSYRPAAQFALYALGN